MRSLVALITAYLILKAIFHSLPVFIPRHCDTLLIYDKDHNYCKLDLIPNCKYDDGLIKIENVDVKMDLTHQFQILKFFNPEKNRWVELGLKENVVTSCGITIKNAKSKKEEKGT